MLRRLLPCALALCFATVPACAQTGSGASARAVAGRHTFGVQGDHFVLDGRPFKVLSGELHYARIPREYWHARLKMAKAMGLNTIATYVFWNVHEPEPGVYDFSGQNDLAAFVRAAQEEGLYVILRSGPYACAEWDWGGLPPWLLKDPKAAQAIRTESPLFLGPAQRWVNRLAKEVLPLQVGRGGPILMTQIENEYGQYGDDHAYMEKLRAIYGEAGFNGKDSLLYTADNWRHVPEGSIPELFAAVNFGINNHQGGMDALAKARPGQAEFVSEYWPGWFDHWGHPHETRPLAPEIADLDYILKRGTGVNIYMFHGGTSFGFMAGSSYLNDKFLPDVTSYDYDAPLDESGRTTPKYFAYRKELAKFSPCGSEACLPEVPSVAAPIALPEIRLMKGTALWDALPKPVASATPEPMEQYGQGYGYTLYRTELPGAAHGALAIQRLHDFAVVYVDGKQVGTLDRRDADAQGRLPVVQIDTNGPARLDILVGDDGRINVGHEMTGETKGLDELVVLDGRPLSDWRVYPLPMTTLPGRAVEHVGTPGTPTWFRAKFDVEKPGDTFLDISRLGKGAAWVNGHALGRFWNVGPQATLYVPGPWLKAGSNEIVIFDMLPTAQESVRGLDHPILDAPVANATRSQQE